VGDLLRFELFDIAPPAPGWTPATWATAVAKSRTAASASGAAWTGPCACPGPRTPVAAAGGAAASPVAARTRTGRCTRPGAASRSACAGATRAPR
jgi:hypothetical protein